jgi:arylsulfatase A-like enzyme
MSLPNIILLTIDGLRYDRLGFSGYEAAHSPNLDRLAREGVSFSNYHTHGSPTQFSFPSIFSSSYPLDEGGYGRGIRNRAASFVEVLQQAGYWTVGLSLGGALTEAYGYKRGFRHYHHLNEISVPLSTAWKNEFAYYRDLFKNGRITLPELVAHTAHTVEQALNGTILLCAEKQAEITSGAIATTPEFHDADFGKIADAMRKELSRLQQSPAGYIEWMIGHKSAEEAYAQLPMPLVSRNRFAGMLHNYANKALTNIDITLRFGRRKHMGAKQVFDSIDKYMNRADGKRFFIWGHVIDVHDLCFGDGKVYLPPVGSPVFRKIKRLGRAYRGLRGYDYAISYVDKLIGRLFAQLKCKGLDQNTMIVVTSDHGLAANWPRPAVSHVANFYEEHCHVPLIFWQAGMQPKNIDALYGSVDLPASLLGFLGLEAPASFKGVNALAENASGRPYILMENLGRGPHDLARKPIRLAIRTQDRKYIMDDKDGHCQVREVYHLVLDPDELTNLVAAPSEQDEIARMAKLGAARCLEIRGQLFDPGAHRCKRQTEF